MRIEWLSKILARHLCAIKRPPDFVIGGEDNAYLRRWWLIPRNRFFNIYLHHFLRDDDDRALHDHPWPSLSLMLRGLLFEIYRGGDGETTRYVKPGDVVFRKASFAHRLELTNAHRLEAAKQYRHLGAWTLFITGPRVREWGFHYPNGWRHWKDFTAAGDSSKVGRGCD